MLLADLLKNGGPIPGKFENMFKGFYNPSLAKVVNDSPRRQSGEVKPKLNQSTVDLLTAEFLKKNDFVYSRPFPGLGSLISGLMLKNLIYFTDFTTLHYFFDHFLSMFYGTEMMQNVSLIDITSLGYFDHILHPTGYKSLNMGCTDENFRKLKKQYSSIHQHMPCENSPCCLPKTRNLINGHFKKFLSLMAYEQIISNRGGSIHQFAELKPILRALFEKYGLSMTEKQNTDIDREQTGFISHCGFGTVDYAMDIIQDLWCEDTLPVTTANGICYSYNALPAASLYKNSEHLTYLENVLMAKEKVLAKVKGSGSLHGMTIIMHSFDANNPMKGKKGDFVFSLSNYLNHHDIRRRQYTIKPGYEYTFQVVAGKTTTTSNFDGMPLSDRKCR
jgi:hypothetical protein